MIKNSIVFTRSYSFVSFRSSYYVQTVARALWVCSLTLNLTLCISILRIFSTIYNLDLPHGGLLTKLDLMGVRGNLFKWIKFLYGQDFVISLMVVSVFWWASVPHPPLAFWNPARFDLPTFVIRCLCEQRWHATTTTKHASILKYAEDTTTRIKRKYNYANFSGFLLQNDLDDLQRWLND